ncbi:MAG: N-6 DNA methylase [Notoacmeibacter sp.]|nr:N-6 DNA methylase [Notoacmeibacter sp.]MCC0031613.1 N-6 DNA methylase [Brucellaceae bacterium]
MAEASLQGIISEFGAATKSKLSNPAVTGAPEDQLRAPLETLIADGIAVLCNVKSVSLVGESTLSEIRTRPDYAVSRANSLIGFIEVKAPGKGADPRKFSDEHDKKQWKKLQTLPNLIYTDGNSFSLWRDGKLAGKIVHLDGDVETSGAKLAAPQDIVMLFADFFNWAPIPPKSPRQLAETSARLCRLLREEVTEQLERGNAGLTGLAEDWRKLLFPDADNEKFADGYAQAVTFGLLIARAMDISLKDGIETAAQKLKKSSSLIGTALGLLTDNEENAQALATSLDTMTRVLNEVNWADVSKDDPEAWLYFYEHFLEVYDNKLRKKTGSYYTPPEVVNAMVRMTDDVLRGPLFNRPLGLASSDVTIADPAVGTGTFLIGVLRRIAQAVEDDGRPGDVAAQVKAAAERLIGFELQFGPFAVAQLRLLAEFQELTKANALPDLKLFITDTLGDPFIDEDWIPQTMQPVAKSRRDANTIKKGQKITVVIGNPPYKEKAEGMGGWIEKGSGGDTKSPMDYWQPPKDWGVGAHAKKLKNLYVFFWRWAAWKVFGAGHYAATGLAEKDEEGIVCFINVASFLNGPGFQRMRADLRATCSKIWVIDCSPEGFQPDVNTRVFEGVQQEVCIVIAVRKTGKDKAKPAEVLFRSLSKGKREEKFEELAELQLGGGGWSTCGDGWRDPFLPGISGVWAEFPALSDLFDYNGSGVMPGRTWVIAPDRQSLETRWKALIAEKDAEKKETLFHPHMPKGELGDRHTTKILGDGLPGHEERLGSVASDKGDLVTPTQYGFRSFDRQWIIPDKRLINRPNPSLWEMHGERQVYLTALDAHSPNAGPAFSFTGDVPDLHHYKGSYGGRTFPLWANAAATKPNLNKGLLDALAATLGREVAPDEVMAYLAALMAHPAFTARFQDDLIQPGLRVPLTADPALFAEAVAIGREVIWLHCHGERFADADAGRPHGPPRMAKGQGPIIPAGGGIPGAPEPLPDTMGYDPATRRLTIGKGFIDNVAPEVWAYEVSGKNVLRQWFSYRKRDRTKPLIGDKRPPSPLDSIQPDHWLSEYTTDLFNLLHVLGRLVLLEESQANLLDKVLDKPLITVADLASFADTGPESD